MIIMMIIIIIMIIMMIIIIIIMINIMIIYVRSTAADLLGLLHVWERLLAELFNQFKKVLDMRGRRIGQL